MMVAGDTVETILREYPALERADVPACLAYAHRSLSGAQILDRIADAPTQ